jgi:hypothetical protein
MRKGVNDYCGKLSHRFGSLLYPIFRLAWISDESGKWREKLDLIG